MINIIKSDLYRYNKLQGFFGFLKGLFFIPGFRFTFFLRLVSKYKKFSIIGIISRFILHILKFRYGYQIDARAKIKKGFYIGHFGPILIGKGVMIGSNCNIGHTVTLGMINKGIKKGVPTIGNNVVMGSGTVIIGNIQIGSNVLIAPNSFVSTNVPDNSTVIGNPAKIIHMDKNPVDGHIEHILN